MNKEQKAPVSSNLTIRQLEVFAMASKSQTFSEAAKRLGISQPSLSNTIAKIEEQLGLRLFDRTTRTLVMTPQGERFSVVADELVRNFQASIGNIHSAAMVSRGRMSIAVIPSVAAAVGPTALKLFFETYPEFDVSLNDISGEKALAWVADRVVDFAIVSMPISSSEIAVETVYKDDFQIICRRDNPLVNKRSITWEDITSASVILASSGTIRRDIENEWTRAGVEIKPRFEIEQIMTSLAMVSAGLGIAVLPGLCRPTMMHQDLVAISLGKLRIQREIVIARRSDRVMSKPVEHMLKCFRKSFADFDSATVAQRQSASKNKPR